MSDREFLIRVFKEADSKEKAELAQSLIRHLDRERSLMKRLRRTRS